MSRFISRSLTLAGFAGICLSVATASATGISLEVSASETLPSSRADENIKTSLYSVNPVQPHEVRVPDQIMTMEDLVKHLAITKNTDSPFYRLSDKSLDQLLESLVFTPRGVASFNYSILLNELEINEVREIIHLFDWSPFMDQIIPDSELTENDLIIRKELKRGDPTVRYLVSDHTCVIFTSNPELGRNGCYPYDGGTCNLYKC